MARNKRKIGSRTKKGKTVVYGIKGNGKAFAFLANTPGAAARGLVKLRRRFGKNIKHKTVSVSTARRSKSGTRRKR